MTLFINKHLDMKKDVMISLRLTPNQYVTLLETLKEKKSKSQFIRESINRSLFRINTNLV